MIRKFLTVLKLNENVLLSRAILNNYSTRIILEDTLIQSDRLQAQWTFAFYFKAFKTDIVFCLPFCLLDVKKLSHFCLNAPNKILFSLIYDKIQASLIHIRDSESY